MALTQNQITGVVFGILAYLALNVTGTVYYTKLKDNQPAAVSDSLMSWNLASVILGWLGLPLLNLSSSITYGVHAGDEEKAAAPTA